MLLGSLFRFGSRGPFYTSRSGTLRPYKIVLLSHNPKLLSSICCSPRPSRIHHLFVGLSGFALICWHKLWGGHKVNAKEVIPVLDFESLQAQVKDEKRVTWEKLSKISATSVNSSVSSLVEITVSRWVETEELYHKYMETLIEVLQVYITAIGTPAEEEVWSSIMFIRGYLAEVKHTRTQLRLLWGNCTGLSEHAGQTAFITGADFSGCRLGETVTAAELSMSRLTALTTQLELELASLEAQEIRKSVKHHEDMSKIRRDSSASTEEHETANSDIVEDGPSASTTAVKDDLT